jgi:hypothetical protein
VSKLHLHNQYQNDEAFRTTIASRTSNVNIQWLWKVFSLFIDKYWLFIKILEFVHGIVSFSDSVKVSQLLPEVKAENISKYQRRLQNYARWREFAL